MTFYTRQTPRYIKSFTPIGVSMSPPVEDVQRRLLEWYAKNMRVLPWRQTTEPYRILVSELMLQQTQVSRVLPKYEAFLDQFPTAESLAQAAPADVIVAWKGLGYNRRALHLHQTARQVSGNGGFPRSPGQLQELPGIGPYTAAAIASFAYNHPVAVVDTNVRRVLQRLMGWPQPIEDLISMQAQQLLPEDSRRWNNAMMELGALVCTDDPKCTICPVQTHCRYEKLPKGEQEQFTYAVSKQSPFKGSDRFFRGRILDLLRENKQMTLDEIESKITQHGKPKRNVTELVSLLEKDGLVQRTGERVSLP